MIEYLFNITEGRTPKSLTKYNYNLHHAIAGIPLSFPQTMLIALRVLIFVMQVFKKETQLLVTSENAFRLSSFSHAF